MVIISRALINEFANKYPDASDALMKWFNETKIADWKNYAELKKSFNSTDAVGNDRYVFNIKGNHYRLIALIIFKTRTLFVLFIGNHESYNNIIAKEVIYKKQ